MTMGNAILHGAYLTVTLFTQCMSVVVNAYTYMCMCIQVEHMCLSVHVYVHVHAYICRGTSGVNKYVSMWVTVYVCLGGGLCVIHG